MNGLETAIRNALARATNPDGETRQRIYTSARQAVVKSLDKQGTSDPAVRAAQMQRVEAVIAQIESAYAPDLPVEATDDSTLRAVEPPRAVSLSPETAAGFVPDQSDRLSVGPRDDIGAAAEAPVIEVGASSQTPAPTVDAVATEVPPGRDRAALEEVAPERRPVPQAVLGADGFQADPDDRLAGPAGRAPNGPIGKADAAVPGERRPDRQKRKGMVGRLFSRKPTLSENDELPRRRKKRRGVGVLSLLTQLALLFVFIAAALWFVRINGGIEEIGRRLANSGTGMLSEDQGGGNSPTQRVGAGQFSGDWVAVFEPGDIDQLAVGGSAAVEPQDNGANGAVRITSISGAEEGEVRIPIEPNALAALAQNQALIALTVRAGDEPTQISVRCDVPSANDCGRRRFDVNHETSDLLFHVDLIGVSPSSGGEIIINSDVSGEGRSIELFSVRAQPSS